MCSRRFNSMGNLPEDTKSLVSIKRIFLLLIDVVDFARTVSPRCKPRSPMKAMSDRALGLLSKLSLATRTVQDVRKFRRVMARKRDRQRLGTELARLPLG